MLGISQGSVSQMNQLAVGLAPVALTALRDRQITRASADALAKMMQGGKPDVEHQITWLAESLIRRRTTSRESMRAKLRLAQGARGSRS